MLASPHRIFGGEGLGVRGLHGTEKTCDSIIMRRKQSQARSPDAIEFARSQRRNQNDFAAAVWQMLKNRRCRGRKFRREYPIPPYTADFCCVKLKLIIEVDGCHPSPPAPLPRNPDHAADRWIPSRPDFGGEGSRCMTTRAAPWPTLKSRNQKTTQLDPVLPIIFREEPPEGGYRKTESGAAEHYLPVGSFTTQLVPGAMPFVSRRQPSATMINSSP